MFDIGFWELAIIAIVTLLVVGPERMPGLLRDIGKWIKTLRRFITQTRYEIERELDFDAEKGLIEKISDMDKLMDIAPDKDTKKPDKDNP